MAKVSKASFYVCIVCYSTVLLLEKIDAMSLICYSSTPPAVIDESDGTEDPFSQVFTTLDITITQTPPQTTTTPTSDDTTEPPITPIQTPSETTTTLPVPTTTPSVTTTTPSETTSTLPVTTTSLTTLPVATSTPTTMTTGQETTPVWTLPVTTSPCGDCPRIVSRADWGAMAPKAITAIRHPIPKVFIHHTKGASCTTQATCSRIVKQIQTDHQTTNGWADIAYNFLVGEDGNAYEGRGWDVQGAHAKKWNPVSLGIAVLGNFMNRVPNDAAVNTVQKLIACGVCKGKIAGNYTLHGHRDGCPTKCPGDALFNLIQKWPNYGGNLGGKC